MIILNKKYKISGSKGPFKYRFLSTNPLVSFDPVSGSIPGPGDVEVKVLIDDAINDQLDNASVSIQIETKTDDGCTSISDMVVLNPCVDFTLSTAIIYSAPNRYTLPSNSLTIGKVVWSVGPGIEIVSGQGTDSIIVKEKTNTSTTTHTISCDVYSPEGCKLHLVTMHHSCLPVIDPFEMSSSCGRYDTTLGSLSYIANSYKVTQIDLPTFIGGSKCNGCEFDYNTLDIKATTTSRPYINPNSIVYIYDTNITTSTMYTYTIKDNCGKIYNGRISSKIPDCSTAGGCYTLPKLNPTYINCSDFVDPEPGNQEPTCGADITDPKYTFTSDYVYGTYAPGIFDWSTFKFILPTNVANTLDYELCSAKILRTPYGIVTIDDNHRLVYKMGLLPTPGTDVTETITYQVTDNTPARCTSTVGSTLFFHTCIVKPIGAALDECAVCFDTVQLPLDLTMNGLNLEKIEVQDVLPNNSTVTVVGKIINGVGYIEVTTNGISGDVTFSYKVTGGKGIPGSSLTSDLVTGNVVHVSCAGKNAIVVAC